MMIQYCAKCGALFRDQQKRNWCFMCWCDRNPTPSTVNVANYRPAKR